MPLLGPFGPHEHCRYGRRTALPTSSLFLHREAVSFNGLYVAYARFVGVPDVHYEEHRHWVCGDMGVSEWTLTGTTTSGVRLEVRGTDHYEFRAGKVVRKDAYWKIVEK